VVEVIGNVGYRRRGGGYSALLRVLQCSLRVEVGGGGGGGDDNGGVQMPRGVRGGTTGTAGTNGLGL